MKEIRDGEYCYSTEKVLTGTITKANSFVSAAEKSGEILLGLPSKEIVKTMTTKDLVLTIPNRYEEIAFVEEQFFAFAVKNEIPDSSRQAMSIVLDELLNNVISYAYQGKKEAEIEVHFELSSGRLILTIKDSGLPFNPFAMKDPDIFQSIEERAVGGLGIYLVRNLMDEYSYQRQINQNVVTLVMLLEKESE